MAFSIVVAGQNITSRCQQMSVDIDDTLGQGSGAGGTSQGRATTFSVLTNLGPISNARGAGNPGGSALVRQGEIVVTDQNGNIVFGGFVSRLTDTTEYTLPFTKIEAIDYSTSLQRVNVNKTYSVQTDSFIIKDLINTYANWIDTSQLPSTAAYTFPVLQLRNITLEQALQKVSRITGYQIWVDFNKKIYYQPPTLNHNAPFALTDTPNFSGTFPHYIEEYYVDDNAIINKVTFYGGKRLSADTYQDVSPLANGNNKVFTAAWYMRGLSGDNHVHVWLNPSSNPPVIGGTGDLVIGNLVAASNDKNNLLKSAGGKCDVLINSDARNVTFDVAPAAGSTVLIGYRYMYPLTVVVTDEKSKAFFGQYLEGTASDETVFDTTTAVQRCKVILLQQSYGLTSIKAHCWRPGIQAGQTIALTNTQRGINGSYVVQQVRTTPLGGGNFDYEITLGAWNWNLVDVVLKLGAAAQPADLQDSVTNAVSIQQAPHSGSSTGSVTKSTNAHTGKVLQANGTAQPFPPTASNAGSIPLVGLFTMTS